MPALIQYLANRGFVGAAVEAAVGTPVGATFWVPILEESLQRDPGIILEKLLRQTRDVAFTPALGEQKIEGTVSLPLYVDQGIGLLAAAIGVDLYQYSTTASSSQAIGGSGIATGVGSFSIAALPSGLAVGGFLELHQTSSANPSATNLSEIHKVASISGSGPYTIGIGSELTRYAYSAGGSAWNAQAGPYVHALLPDQPSPATWKTLTVEKNLGGLTSLQYAGAVVAKAALKLTAKEAAKLTCTLMAMGDAQITGSTPSFGSSAPLALPNFAVSLYGAADTSVATFDLEVDNGAKNYWTFTGANLPALIVPVERKVTGKFTNVVQSMAYYNNMAAGTMGPFVLTFAQGASSLAITLPLCVITKLGVPLKVGDLLLYDAEFQATYSATSANSISGQLTSPAVYLPVV